MNASKSLLVPVDGTPGSLRALQLACGRVKARRKGGVVALNVQLPMPPSRFVSRGAIREHQERMAAEVFAKVRRLGRKEGVPIATELAIGLPAQEILRRAEQPQVEELVMGTRGPGRVGGFLLGSVAMKVVQLCKVPVTLVK